MKVGHVDGRGEIYNDKGQLILEPQETVECHVAGDTLNLSEGSSVWNMKTIFGHTAEKGSLVITNRRIVLIMAPDPFLAAKYDSTPYGLADAVSKAYRASALKKMKALEYCEIPFTDVEGFWVVKRTYGVLFLKSSPSVTRKAIMYQRGPKDDKFVVLKRLLSAHLPQTEPEDRKGSFLLGKRYPFRGRGRRERRHQ
jgi:hypothetical protein